MKMPRVASSTPWGAGLANLLMISLLCGLVVYWGLVLVAPAVSIAPAGSLVSQNTGLDTGLASTMFGRANGAAPIASAPLPRNIKVVGIAASADRSAVIVSVDGQTAAAFGVGQQIDDSLKVVSVDTSEVVLDHRGDLIRVPAPASGDLSALNSNNSGINNSRNSASVTRNNPPPTPAAAPNPVQPSNNAIPSRRLAGATSGQSTREPLPPRTLPLAGAAANPTPSPLRQRQASAPPIAASQDANRPPTALGQALQQMERPNPVVQR